MPLRLIIVAGMRAIFLSDAHLRHPQDQNYQLLLEFLNQQKQLDALFLLGDIFEFWLGYDHLVFSAYVPLLEKLRQFSAAGTRLYFVEGNHDFLLGRYFRETLNCTIIPEQQIISWDGLKIMVCHGDLLNPGAGYRQLRKFWRSRFVRGLARIVHPDQVWRFGLWLSSKSAKNDPDRPHHDPLPYLQTYVEKNARGCDLVVAGHFHYPRTASYENTRIIALGDWIHQFSYAELMDGKLELKSFDHMSPEQ